MIKIINRLLLRVIMSIEPAAVPAPRAWRAELMLKKISKDMDEMKFN